MKKLFTVLTLLLVNSVLSAIVPPTVPQKMSYQAVIRNSSNVLVTNQQVGMKTSILQGSATGTAVYVEIYNPNYITNANGLVTVEIGGGIPLTGTFSSINWATGPYFIKTEVDPTGGTSYTITAISELLSVPYALHAKTAQTADYNSLSNLPIFATVATTGSYNDLINKPLLPVPGGVTGNVQFNNAGVLGGDANFKWDNANKRLGIGISIPSYQLQVMGDNLRAIHGETSHSSGAAIFGVGNSSSGSNVGVRGTSNSTNGTGI